MKKYLPCTDGQELQVEVRYSKDSRVRGYYLSVTPVKRNGDMISFMLYSGVRALVKEVTRKSAKAEREAIEAAAAHEQELIEMVLKAENLTLSEVTA